MKRSRVLLAVRHALERPAASPAGVHDRRRPLRAARTRSRCWTRWFAAGRPRGLRVVAAHLDHRLRDDSADDARLLPGAVRIASTCACARRLGGRARPRARETATASSRRRGSSATRSCARVQADEGAVRDRARAHARRPGGDGAAAPAARLGPARARRHARAHARPLAARCSPCRARTCSPTWRRAGWAGGRIPATATCASRATACGTSSCRTSNRASTRACARRSRGRRRCSAGEADALARAAARLARRAGAADPGGPALSRSVLRAAPPAVAALAIRRLLDEAGGLRDVGASHVRRLLGLVNVPAASGRRLPLPGGRVALVRFDRLVLARVSPPPAAFAAPLGVPGQVDLPDGRVTVRAEEASARRRRLGAATRSSPAGPALEVRTRRPGDRIRSRGRDISLKRYLLDRRVPADLRPGLPLVAAGSLRRVGPRPARGTGTGSGGVSSSCTSTPAETLP